MLRIKVACTGVFWLLMNAMNDETLTSLLTGVRKDVKKDTPPKTIAEGKLYKNDDGVIGFPPENMFACLRDAGRDVKLSGKKSISTAETTTLPSFLTIENMFIPLNNGNGDGEAPEWVVDKRRGMLKSGKGKGVAVCLVRPKFKDWGFEVTVLVDNKIVSEDTVRALFDKAGSLQGLGDFRPSCKGPFGRFKVVGWEATKLDDASSDGKGGKAAVAATAASIIGFLAAGLMLWL